jgi:hypothetical protein
MKSFAIESFLVASVDRSGKNPTSLETDGLKTLATLNPPRGIRIEY